MSKDPGRTLHEYVAAYVAHDVDAIVDHFDLPAVFVNGARTVVVGDRTEASAMVEAMLAHSTASDHHHTAIEHLMVQRLSESLALATGEYQRFNARDEPTQRFAFHYVLRAVDDLWRIWIGVAS